MNHERRATTEAGALHLRPQHRLARWRDRRDGLILPRWRAQDRLALRAGQPRTVSDARPSARDV